MTKTYKECVDDIAGVLGEFEEVFGAEPREDEEENNAVQTALDKVKNWKDILDNHKDLEVYAVN